LLFAELIALERFATHGTRIAGVALMATAALSSLSLVRAHGSASALEARSPLFVGVVHGLTGAASLLLVLPMIASGSIALTLSFLVAFGLGSALAMAGLTFAIARVGQRLTARNVLRTQWALTLAGFAVGALFLAS
jgi:nickel/cobalt exporter